MHTRNFSTKSSNISPNSTVVVQDEVEVSIFLRRTLNCSTIKHLSAWLWEIACDREAPSRMQKFLSIYRKGKVPSIASCVRLVDAYDFCFKHGYPFKDIKGAQLEPLLLSNSDWTELDMPNVQAYIHDYLNKDQGNLMFLDLFSKAHDPLLNMMRREFAAMQSLIQVTEDCEKSPASGIKFKTLNAEAHWIAEKIQESRNNFPNARIAVISGNHAILHKIKAELLGIPCLDHHPLHQTTLGMLIYDMAAHYNKGEDRSQSDFKVPGLMSNKLSLEETVVAHKKVVLDQLENSNEEKIEIVKDFFDTLINSLSLDTEEKSHLCIDEQEYQKLICELLHMYFVESQLNQSTNPIAFKTPALTFDVYDIVFLPGMNNETWIPQSQNQPIIKAIASSFHEDYRAPVEDTILESILNSDSHHVYLTCNESETPHRLLLNFPWKSDPTLEIPKERYKQTTTLVRVPLNARLQSFSVADIQLLMDDPYAFYTKRILGLRPKERDERAVSVKSIVRDLLREYFAIYQEQSTPLHNFANQWIEENAIAPQFIPKLCVIIQSVSQDLIKRNASGAKMISDYKIRMIVTVKNIDYVIYGTIDRVDLYPECAPSKSLEQTFSPNAKSHIISYSRAPTNVSVQNLRNITSSLKALMFMRSAENRKRKVSTPPALEFCPFGESTTCIQNSDELMHGTEVTLRQVLERYSDESFTFGNISSHYPHLSRM